MSEGLLRTGHCSKCGVRHDGASHHGSTSLAKEMHLDVYVATHSTTRPGAQPREQTVAMQLNRPTIGAQGRRAEGVRGRPEQSGGKELTHRAPGHTRLPEAQETSGQSEHREAGVCWRGGSVWGWGELERLERGHSSFHGERGRGRIHRSRGTSGELEAATVAGGLGEEGRAQKHSGRVDDRSSRLNKREKPEACMTRRKRSQGEPRNPKMERGRLDKSWLPTASSGAAGGHEQVIKQLTSVPRGTWY